jgi:hypothetical protein
MGEKLPFAGRVQRLVADFPTDDSQRFLDGIFSLVIQALNMLGMNRKPNDGGLVLLLLRFVFDLVDEKNPFLVNDGEDILEKLSKMALEYLSPSADFLPLFDPSQKVKEFFRNNPLFSKAIGPLDHIGFYTNTFVILYCVEKSLTFIERVAFHDNKGETLMFPFEVTFGLFLGVVIASGIKNWENIADFIESFTPLAGLCPAFEFSKAKIVASLMQFQQMMEDQATW